MGQLRIANCSCGSYAKNNRAPKSSWPGQIWAAVLPGPVTTNKVKEVMGVGGGRVGTILRCSDPKSNRESKYKHWLTPVPLNKYAKSLNNRAS